MPAPPSYGFIVRPPLALVTSGWEYFRGREKGKEGQLSLLLLMKGAEASSKPVPYLQFIPSPLLNASPSGTNECEGGSEIGRRPVIMEMKI